MLIYDTSKPIKAANKNRKGHKMKISYKTSATSSRTIDTDTASIGDLESAHLYLSAMADSDGAFPGTKAYREAAQYRATLDAMMEARPDFAAKIAATESPELSWDKMNA